MKYGEYIKTPDGLGRTQDPAWHGVTLAEGEVLVSVLSGHRGKLTTLEPKAYKMVECALCAPWN